MYRSVLVENCKLRLPPLKSLRCCHLNDLTNKQWGSWGQASHNLGRCRRSLITLLRQNSRWCLRWSISRDFEKPSDSLCKNRLLVMELLHPLQYIQLLHHYDDTYKFIWINRYKWQNLGRAMRQQQWRYSRMRQIRENCDWLDLSELFCCHQRYPNGWRDRDPMV
jgi:hypothetical protein